MLNKESCFYLGAVSKARGYKGELMLFLDVDNPHAYSKLKSVLVELADGLHPYFIQRIHIDAQGYAIVQMEGVETRAAAIELSGKALFLPLDKLPELPDHEHYLHELPGMLVSDEAFGELGTVESVLDYSLNPLLQIFRNGFEVLIPLQDSFVLKVDKASKHIMVRIPEALLEMNKM